MQNPMSQTLTLERAVNQLLGLRSGMRPTCFIIKVIRRDGALDIIIQQGVSLFLFFGLLRLQMGSDSNRNGGGTRRSFLF